MNETSSGGTRVASSPAIARLGLALGACGVLACTADSDIASTEAPIAGGFVVTDTSAFYNDVNRAPVTLDVAGGGTGVLVAPRIVLTAGHNATNGGVGGPAMLAIFGPNPSAPDEVVPVVDEIDMPNFCSNCGPRFSNIDLGVWVLAYPPSVALPFWSYDSVEEEDEAAFFGAGASSPRGPFPLRWTTCGDSTAGVYDVYSMPENDGARFNTECIGLSQGGDSGGPIFDLHSHRLLGINIGYDVPAPGPGNSVAMQVHPYAAWVQGFIDDYRATLVLGDFDDDDRGDLLFWNNGDRGNSVDVSAGGLPDAVADDTFTWCAQQLFTGDFNGDGADDLLCFDPAGNMLYLDYASERPIFGGTNAGVASDWCDGVLRVGDFDGDGRDDLVCREGGILSVDLSSGVLAAPFGGSDWATATSFCSSGELFVGRFNLDARDDLLCRTLGVGLEQRLAGIGGTFLTSASLATAWCGQTLYVGDVTGDTRDDLICWDAHGENIWIDYAEGIGFPFAGVTDWGDVDFPFCGQARSVHDMNDDGRVDLVCHDDRTGLVWIDYASSTTPYHGVWNARIPNIDTPIWPPG